MKVKTFLHWKENYDGTMEPVFFTQDMTEYDYFCAGEVEVEVPDQDPPTKADVTKVKVSNLRAKQGTHQHEIDKIEEAIQQLLCIEYKPESEASHD